MADRPTARRKNVTGSGFGLGKTGSTSGGGGGGSKIAKGAGGGSAIVIILMILYVLFGGGGSGNTQNSGSLISHLGSLSSISDASTGWSEGLNNNGKINTSTAEGTRERYTEILGGGRDTVTMMVYLCGTDLESKYGMATNDLKEMANATINNKLNIIVYTGGCSSWKTSGISSSQNQIYKIENGAMTCLSKNEGNASLTDPNTLTSFINYCNKNYPANRKLLIFWDHGGGSISGFGYDQTHKDSGSMSLVDINNALSAANTKFDMIGFDACLMATAENALMLTKYADYLVASEETEPGLGWYYTNFLTNLASDTSMDTVDLGKQICDDFVSACARSCPGQGTTLSVTDLAELEKTFPPVFNNFAKKTSELNATDFARVSKARKAAKEFSRSSSIDQIDLASLANNLGTPESSALKDCILSAVKYNRVGNNITNACGLSVYYPSGKSNKLVKAAKAVYKSIGFSDEYSRCISDAATMTGAGQSVSGYETPLGSLIGQSASSSTQQIMSQVIGSFLSGAVSSQSGLTSSDLSFLSDRNISDSTVSEYVSTHSIDSSMLVWQNGKLTLPEQMWESVQYIDRNLFVQDNDGFLDLGLDNVYTFDQTGNLVPDTEKTCIGVNNHIAAYYHTETVDDENGEDYVIKGYIPALLNGDKVKLLVVFDSKKGDDGYIAGAEYDYDELITETQSKNITEIKNGDKITFLCKHYNLDGTYDDTYTLEDPITVNGELKVSDVTLGDRNVKINYLFTDIYEGKYWTNTIE